MNIVCQFPKSVHQFPELRILKHQLKDCFAQHHPDLAAIISLWSFLLKTLSFPDNRLDLILEKLMSLVLRLREQLKVRCIKSLFNYKDRFKKFKNELCVDSQVKYFLP